MNLRTEFRDLALSKPKEGVGGVELLQVLYEGPLTAAVLGTQHTCLTAAMLSTQQTRTRPSGREGLIRYQRKAS